MNEAMNGQPPSRGVRAGWRLGSIDSEAMALLDDATLLREIAIAQELIAPFSAFIEAAEKRLSGDPDWKPVPAAHLGAHRHADSVRFPNGTTLVARSFVAAGPYEREVQPDRGLYFDRAWSPTWVHRHVNWPDFGIPQDRDDAVSACAEALKSARNGESVEIGCLGGHGRTGTALALMAVLCGVPAQDAVGWVRTNYCPSAVETPEQEAFIQTFAS